MHKYYTLTNDTFLRSFLDFFTAFERAAPNCISSSSFLHSRYMPAGSRSGLEHELSAPQQTINAFIKIVYLHCSPRPRLRPPKLSLWKSLWTAGPQPSPPPLSVLFNRLISPPPQKKTSGYVGSLRFQSKNFGDHWCKIFAGHMSLPTPKWPTYFSSQSVVSKALKISGADVRQQRRD